MSQDGKVVLSITTDTRKVVDLRWRDEHARLVAILLPEVIADCDSLHGPDYLDGCSSCNPRAERYADAIIEATRPIRPAPRPAVGPIEYECPQCLRVAPWTDGTTKASGQERDEFWCQTCGEETPLEECRVVDRA